MFEERFAGVILTDGDKVVTQQRNNKHKSGNNSLQVPGGGFSKMERILPWIGPKEVTVREILEELGIKINPKELTPLAEKPIHVKGKGVVHHTIYTMEFPGVSEIDLTDPDNNHFFAIDYSGYLKYKTQELIHAQHDIFYDLVFKLKGLAV